VAAPYRALMLPMSGADASALSGLRVLDAGSFLAAPYAAMLLADWGADVVKLEPRGGDPVRVVGPQVQPGITPTFAAVNRGKRSLAVDLRSDAGRDVARRLARDSDVVVHNLAPDVAQALGLGGAAIVCAVSAFGAAGTYARPGLDPVVQAMAGMASLGGDPDGPPMRTAAPVVDIATGLAAAGAILAALAGRGIHGRGAALSISLLDTALALQGPLLALRSVLGEPPPRRGNGSFATLGDQLATRDGHVAFTVWDDERWAALCRILDLADLAADPRLATNDQRVAALPDLGARLSAAAAGWRAADLEAALLEAGIPAAVTRDLDAVAADPELWSSGALYGESRLDRPMELAGNPVCVDARRPVASRPPPRCGEHSRALLSGRLGFDAARIDALVAAEIIIDGAQRPEETGRG